MFEWLKTIYSGSNKDTQILSDDLKKIKHEGFLLLENMSVDDKLPILRNLNQIIDSELSVHRYRQSERRLRHTLVLALFSLLGGGAGIVILNHFFK